MMGSPTHEANSNHQDRSDLTQIRGIGAVRKRWLHSLGIVTIADLAQASADAIEAQAKSDGRSLSREELEAWIAQAQVHHVEASLEQVALSPTVDAIAPASVSNSLTAERTEAEANPSVDWHSIASFKVDYQTRSIDGNAEQRLVIHHFETDATESWNGFETDQMQQWLRDRVAATLRHLQADHSIVADPIVAEITQLRVLQPHSMKRPIVADRTSPIFPDAIQTTEPFALEVSMQFGGLATHQEKHVAYQVQCLARNLATGRTDSLGTITSQFALASRSTHQVLLPSLLLRQPGTYRLKVLVTPQNAPAAVGQFKVPILQVV